MLGSLFYRFALWLVGLGAWIMPAAGQDPLRRVEEDLAQRFAALLHDAPARVAERMSADPSKVLLLDVRSEAEFAVSRIPGAIHVDSKVQPDAFRERFASLVDGRDVVAYCSVGQRSSRFATRLQSTLAAAGAASVGNLSGGIFRWHNERRNLVDDAGPSVRIHPFNAYWARFLLPSL